MKKILLFLFLFIFNINAVYANEKILVDFSACVDGDTIKIMLDDEVKTVRLLAVDTPESVHPKKGVEYYGKEASEYTCNKVKDAKKLEIMYDDNSDKADKYGRLLAWVFVDDYLLQDLIVSNAYGEVAYLYGDYRYTDLLKDHQSVAEAKKIGIYDDNARDKFNNVTEEELSYKEIIIIVIIMGILMLIPKKYRKMVKLK